MKRTRRCGPCYGAWVDCKSKHNLDVMDHLASWKGPY
jgi:hypothetical protein